MSQIPHRCPVCNGSGQVDQSLYTYCGCNPLHTTAGFSVVSCRSCGGTGVVWSPEPAGFVGVVPQPPFVVDDTPLDNGLKIDWGSGDCSFNFGELGKSAYQVAVEEGSLGYPTHDDCVQKWTAGND